MPTSKDALGRYRVIDRLLSDPNNDYTTSEIMDCVNKECSGTVTLRMIQKDIKALEEFFGKEMVRNAGRRGSVRYADQAEPLFYQELTSDEEEILREALRTLGQFEGLADFTWLDLLKKKLDLSEVQSERPKISYGNNNVLQIHHTLLGRLFTAIARKKTIRIGYTVFGGEKKAFDVYPYQLRQFNNRWFLLCNIVGNEKFPFNPDFIANFALDRMDSEFRYLEEVPYIDTVVDIQDRFDEIVGVTFLKEEVTECIYYAVSPKSQTYIRTKWLHFTQMELAGKDLDEYRARYPEMQDWAFFSIECRPNPELYSLFASYGGDLVVLEPERIRKEMERKIREAYRMYGLDK